MNKKAYTSIIGAFLCLVLNFLGTSNLFAQEATFDLRFLTAVDCNQDGLTATLQMKVRNDSFRIGTSSILFNYDETVLTIKDYESLTFDENDKVSIFGTEQPVWSPHKFNSTVPGICNLTLLIDIAAASLPAVNTDWIDIGKVNFDIINLNASPNLTFDIPNTNFNKYDPNDGSAAPAKGDFINYNELLATQCACNAPTVSNDTLNFDCFENSFTANLISNDAISNATFSITADPTKGTASINPNGQLTFTANDFFCGSDQLTYQVCNDGDAQCCAEAFVFINFSDNIDPIFPNPPLDITVSCDELPILETLVATDDCSDIQMTQEESIIDGDCVNSKIHVRTWTAFDGCGNSEVYTQNITVVDNVPPVINCLEDHIVLCESGNNGIIDSGTPSYADNCSDSSNITLSFVDGVLQEFSQDKVVGQFTRTWTATDECGNFSSCEQVIQIIDDVAPVLFCPSDVTVSCGDDITVGTLPAAEAYDSCSAVTLSFVDVGDVPVDCNFDAKTIIRTWTAEDACGNKTECTQNIVIQGAPCSTTINREITKYLCEGATVNLNFLMGFDANQVVAVFDNNETPISNSTAYTLPLTGCETGRFEFVFQTNNGPDCITELSTLIIITIPNLIVSPSVAEDKCSAELVLECPDKYEVTWEAGLNSGEGATYVATPGESGFVVFTMTYVDSTLPDSLDLICLTSSYEVWYECETDCPTGIQETIQITGCEGDFINLMNELQINENDSIVSSITTIGDLQEYELIADSDSCGIVQEEFSVTIYNENGCPIRYVNFELAIVQKPIGTISHDNDFCTVQLNLACPELYNVYWEDNNNEVGFGGIYEGAEGTSGVVTFHVSLLDTTVIGNGCGDATFVADYSCSTNCPEAIERNESFTACAETTINIFERLDLSTDKTYVTENNDIIDGVYQIGNFFGCQTGVKNHTILGYDDNQCLVETINVEITILPAIYGDIFSPTDTGCVVTLGLECPENYTISWADNLGNSGTGTTYVPTENTSGTVTFTVDFIPETIILSAFELGCMQKTFEASFNCTEACPETTERAESFVACAQTTINIFERLNLSDDKTYIFDNELVVDGEFYMDSQFGCVIGTKDFVISGYDDNQCLVEIINLSVTILPPFFTNEARTNDDGCEVSLSLECSELYTVTWEDDKGRTGEGLTYPADENTSGTVKFFVNFASDDIILPDTGLACISAIAEGIYNCTSNCPETISRDENIVACATSTINIFDRILLTDDKTYVIENADIVDGVYQIGNPFGCEVGTKNIQIKGYNENQCLVEIIHVDITVLPAIYADVSQPDGDECELLLSLECPEHYTVTWEDDKGRTGTGPSYIAEENTSGYVKFFVDLAIDEIILSDVELACFGQIVEGTYNCTTDCPEPIAESIELTGCHGDIVNLKERLIFSENLNYIILDNENNLNAEEIVLHNNTNDCSIETHEIIVEVSDTNNCVTKVLSISFKVIPEIRASLVATAEGCGQELELACPEKYTVVWTDNLGNRGEGLIYEAEAGTTGIVEFEISYVDSLLVGGDLVNASCLSLTIANDFGCCNPVGTACDDGKPETLGDQEDGDCGCFGIPCALDNKGIVFDGSEIGGCSLLIEMSDGTIIEPAVLPDGVTLENGQELLFSFIELTDRVSVCQSGKIVEIICLENNCPEKGTPCTDGDLATINDAYDGNCNCVGESVPEVESEIDLRFRPSLDCASNAYCVMIQGRAQQKDFSIGTSSIMVNYNSNALEFVEYTSAQFDENETCIGGTSSPWGKHQYDATSVPGKMCLTMILDAEGVSCPEITTEDWEDIGQICFDIMDNEVSPNITFDTSKTHFNSSTPNDGTAAIKIGELHEIDTEDALACATNDVAVMRAINIKAFLQGAYKANKGLMTDQLRKKGFLPLTEPYTGLPSFVHFGEGGGETTTNEVLQVNGDNAIVDWVFLELRSATDAKTIITTRAGLIQRDGDIVDVDGVSPIQFMVPDEAYYVSIKHRNHLGTMTGAPVDFSAEADIAIDFTNPEMATYGTHAQTNIKGVMTLWGGNANPDNRIILAGGGLGLPDRDMIFFDIFLSLWYANPDRPITYNSVLHGYYGSDTNLDGKVKYQGPRNDIDAIIFFNVLFHPENTQYRLNFSITEQIP